jgi:hypothetical protein
VVFSGAGVLAALVSGVGDGVCSVALAAGITTADSSDPAAAVLAMSLCDSFAVLRIGPASFLFLFAGWLVCHAIWVLVVLAGHTLFLIFTTKVSAEICATANSYTGRIS